MRTSLILLTFILCACTNTNETTAKPDSPNVLPEIYSHVSGMTFITQDLEASINFYEQYLGYVIRGRRELDTIAGKSVFGLKESDPGIPYAVLVPAEFSPTNTNFPGLNFAEIKSSQADVFNRSQQREPVSGEIVIAFNVTGLEKIHTKIQANNIPIMVPLAPSATGKSLALTIMDPNGIRIQMYEYIDE